MQQPASSPDFCFDVRPDRDRAIVAVAGELDLGTAPRVAATVDELVDAGFARIVVDLRRLSFLDSAGVHALISARDRADRHRCALSLVRAPRDVHRVFALTATESLVRFDDGREIA
jgi:anti-sigma B factor antagonist